MTIVEGGTVVIEISNRLLKSQEPENGLQAKKTLEFIFFPEIRVNTDLTQSIID